MGQKVNPFDLRLGILTSWPSKWFSMKNYAKYLSSDRALRAEIHKRLPEGGITKIEVERSTGKTAVRIFSSRPGAIIGRSGNGADELRNILRRSFGGDLDVSVHEVPNADTEAAVLADMVARQIERRVMFRRAMKSAVRKGMEGGAKGVKVEVAGRLGGAEISRTESTIEGKIPLHTFRADISYAIDRANTTYGVIGVKVWIFRGEVFDRSEASAA